MAKRCGKRSKHSKKVEKARTVLDRAKAMTTSFCFVKETVPPPPDDESCIDDWETLRETIGVKNDMIDALIDLQPVIDRARERYDECTGGMIT